MKTFRKLLVVLSLVAAFAPTSMATSLDEARANKTIAELPNGYVKATDAKTKSFADEINQKRKLHYEQIAKKNGLTVDQVAAQAAKKIEEKLNSK